MFAPDVEDVFAAAAPAPPRSAAGVPAPGDAPAPGVPASGGVLALRQAIAALAVVDPVGLPQAQALADASALLCARTELDAVLLRRLADVQARKLHRLDASPTISAWVRAHGSPVDAATVRLASRLSRLPGLAEAVQSGLVTPAAAARVSTALAKLRPLVDRPDGLIDGQPGDAVVTAVVCDGVLDLVGQALGGVADDDRRIVELTAQLSETSCWPTSQIARLEAAFVLLAEHVPAADLPGALSQLVDALLPLQLEQRAARTAEQARLTLDKKSDGSGWLLRGELDLETGELVFTALTAMVGVDPDNVIDTVAWQALRDAGWEFGDPVPDHLNTPDGPCTLPRSRARRLHDALKLLLRAALDSGTLGQRDKAAPHIDVTTSLAGLNADPGARPATGRSGASLPLSLVKKWWCDAHITRYVLGLGHRVLAVSHTERTLRPHERRIKRLETGGVCQGAGCPRGPGHPLIPHHVEAWARHGTTSLETTALLCEQTHSQLHCGRTITLRDGRRLDQNGWVD